LIVLAGMDEEKSSRATSGLSWLPALFRSVTAESGRTQLVLLLEVRPTDQAI
jgi:hypothetical protein